MLFKLVSFLNVTLYKTICNSSFAEASSRNAGGNLWGKKGFLDPGSTVLLAAHREMGLNLAGNGLFGIRGASSRSLCKSVLCKVTMQIQ